MKRLNRIVGLLLVLILVFSLCVIPVGAASNSMSNFRKQQTYYSRVFSDVTTSQWSYSVIKTCYEYGLMQGSGNRFNCTGNLTVAEALVMADRVHQIYHTGSNTLGNGSPWYQPYVDYAISNGIITSRDFTSYTASISRADMAYVFANALPSSELPEIKSVISIPDINSAPGRDRSAIWTLYRAGVLTGNNAYGAFSPNSNITRQEAAAIIARIAIFSERRNDVLLQQVTDYAVSFGLPQTGSLQQTTTSNGARMHAATGSPIAVDIYTIYDASFAQYPLTSIFTLADEKKAMENGGFSNCTVTKVSFGKIYAYRSVGYLEQYPMVTYRFVADSTLYRVTFAWSENGIDNDMLKKVCNSITVKGNSVSPTFNP